METDGSHGDAEVDAAREEGERVTLGRRHVKVLTALGFALAPRPVLIPLGRVERQLVNVEGRGSARDSDNVVASQVDLLPLHLVLEDSVNAAVEDAALRLVARPQGPHKALIDDLDPHREFAVVSVGEKSSFVGVAERTRLNRRRRGGRRSRSGRIRRQIRLRRQRRQRLNDLQRIQLLQINRFSIIIRSVISRDGRRKIRKILLISVLRLLTEEVKVVVFVVVYSFRLSGLDRCGCCCRPVEPVMLRHQLLIVVLVVEVTVLVAAQLAIVKVVEIRLLFLLLLIHESNRRLRRQRCCSCRCGCCCYCSCLRSLLLSSIVFLLVLAISSAVSLIFTTLLLLLLPSRLLLLLHFLNFNVLSQAIVVVIVAANGPDFVLTES